MKASVDWLIRVGLVCVIGLQAIGCSQHGSGSGGSGGSGGGTPGTPDTSLIGNWQFQVTSTGNQPFTALSGFVNEQGTSGDSTFVTASLQVQSDSCFASTKVIDLEGFTKNPLTQLTGIPADSQVVTLGLSQQCTNVSLCGTYTIAGGCADQTTGTIVGTKFTPLTGTFSTSSGAPAGLKMTLNQASQGTGQGNFQVSGSMAFTGLSCATAATIDPTQSFLSGSALNLVATTNGAGTPQLTVTATIDPAATTLTLNAITSSGSDCFQPLNGAILSNAQ